MNRQTLVGTIALAVALTLNACGGVGGTSGSGTAPGSGASSGSSGGNNTGTGGSVEQPNENAGDAAATSTP